ncbi:GNAT family N-acetyltransferase [Paenibacillus ginsengarvi]|uniref:GNAT family N-acetyltransferase n=1 Tax=Paenibacillus ginsengarvi TaxID=400777 RepID=A0A3B0BNT6_9BACL|nr:GNAT family N-acetyltransferase [Paenibacillus ginsengarvi]RKN73006.1 GNAT family N-acetyltransferase [Paenibacillus ginsengarvi]
MTVPNERTYSITYKTNEPVTAEALSELFEASGIRRPTGDYERLQRMIDNADELFTAWDGERLVGAIRAVTDYSYCCYISDLAVDQNYQGQHIGKQLVGMLIDKLGDEEVQFVLTSAPKAVGFYEQIGFEKADKAFVWKRKRNR